MKMLPQRVHCSAVASPSAAHVLSFVATAMFGLATSMVAISSAKAAEAKRETTVTKSNPNMGMPVATNPTASKPSTTANANASLSDKPSFKRTTATITPSADQVSKLPPLSALGTGDVVSMQVLGHPELDTTVAIAEDGTLTAPLVGDVAVSGLSASAASQKLATAYKKGQYIKNPQVVVLVKQSRSQLVTVFGEVRNPGRYVVDSSTSIFDLIAEAGGTTERSGNVLYLIRTIGPDNVERSAIDLRGLGDDKMPLKLPALRAGDSMYVSAAEQFYIYGEVHSPNMYRLEPDMTVLQAISRGGGLTNLASSRRIEIKRRNAKGQLVTSKVDLNERVRPDDVIYVKESLF